MNGTKHDDEVDFSSLSLKDLIEARDLYHFHLMSKANVVGTAIGLYLIREEEDWPQARGEGVRPRRKLTYPRTLANSEVRDYSWPCILVLVREWIAGRNPARTAHGDDRLPGVRRAHALCLDRQTRVR
jgi:hypothetical protein